VIVRSEAAESRREIEIRVRAFMARRLYDASSFYPIIGEMDPVLQAALQQWPSATSLAARGR
jgi:carboxyl-terminal processing protease